MLENIPLRFCSILTIESLSLLAAHPWCESLVPKLLCWIEIWWLEAVWV